MDLLDYVAYLICYSTCKLWTGSSRVELRSF